MKKVLSLIGLFCVLNAHSQIIQYASSARETIKGAGHEKVFAYSGLMIFEPSNTNVTFIHWSTNKVYTVTGGYIHRVNVNGLNGRSFTLLATSGSQVDDDGTYHLNNNLMQGLNKNLTIATGNGVLFPSIFTGTANRAIAPNANGDEFFYVWNETFTFLTRTVTDNNNNLSVDDVVARTSLALEARGYVRH
jgi:hypothetical protein